MKRNIWNLFVPDTNQVFFNLFNESAANTTTMADLLHEALNTEDCNHRKPFFNHISRLKATSGELRQQVYAVSSKSFISPFERNDMLALAFAIDKVSNTIDIAGRRVNLYLHQDVPPFARELSGIIADCSHELEKSIKLMNDLRNSEVVAQSCERVKEYEGYADTLYTKAIHQLLAEQLDTLELIKHSDILSSLEKVTDRCENVTQVLETIIIKNS